MPIEVNNDGYPSVGILYSGNRSTISVLQDAAFTQDNRVGNTQKTQNTTLSADTPKGILAGSIAAMHADETVGPADATHRPVGIFIGNAQGNPFENSAAVASGKVPHIHQMATLSVEVYETRNFANAANLTYVAGEVLFTSQNGLLTNESGISTVPVAVVVKAPSASDARMTIQMLI